MQVFMPYPDLQKSVCCLDNKRLGNQVYREGLTLLRGGWKNHPAAKIWADYKPALALYCLLGMDELVRRKRIPPNIFTINKELKTFLNNTECIDGCFFVDLPPIVTHEPFHLSHQDNLIFKDSFHYQPIFNRPIPQKKPEYVWLIPTQENKLS